MEPLDLRERPPRSPRERLDGLVMLPRTIDKARAQLPGGDPGSYFISPGMSAFLLGKIGISEADFVAVVAAARDDADVGARVLAGVSRERRERWTAMLEALQVGGMGPDLRPAFDQLYGPQPPDRLVFDVVDEDDAAAFARTRLV